MPTDPLMNLGCTSKYPTTGCFSQGNARKTRGWGIQCISIFRHTHIVSYNFQPVDPDFNQRFIHDFPISPTQIAFWMGPKNGDVQSYPAW